MAHHDSGFPEMFRANIIPDAWWAVRPSLSHPTLELRLTDCCTSVDDAQWQLRACIALVRRCVEDRQLNSEFSGAKPDSG